MKELELMMAKTNNHLWILCSLLVNNRINQCLVKHDEIILDSLACNLTQSSLRLIYAESSSIDKLF